MLFEADKGEKLAFFCVHYFIINIDRLFRSYPL